MPSKRAGAIAALLLTAALLAAMPGLLARLRPGDGNRMDERLRPARLRTLRVWLMPDDMQDQRLLARLCSEYEKQNPGVRVFLRSVSQEEWTQPDAVLPDVVLFSTGAITQPERLLQPLTGLGDLDISAGRSGGVCYAVPLWLAPNVLTLPQAWFDRPSAAPSPTPLFGLSTPVPQAEPAAPDIPWDAVIRPGGLARPEGVAQQQLLLACPPKWREALAAAPTADGAARVTPLPQYLQSGQNLSACPLLPNVCSRVRYAGLCGDWQEARRFLDFLVQQRIQGMASGYLPYGMQVDEPGLLQALSQSAPILPNAFAHTAQELNALCADAFDHGRDPAETLLRLQ